jgi:hypothetical protein
MLRIVRRSGTRVNDTRIPRIPSEYRTGFVRIPGWRSVVDMNTTTRSLRLAATAALVASAATLAGCATAENTSTLGGTAAQAANRAAMTPALHQALVRSAADRYVNELLVRACFTAALGECVLVAGQVVAPPSVPRNLRQLLEADRTIESSAEQGARPPRENLRQRLEADVPSSPTPLPNLRQLVEADQDPGAVVDVPFNLRQLMESDH